MTKPLMTSSSLVEVEVEVEAVTSLDGNSKSIVTTRHAIQSGRPSESIIPYYDLDITVEIQQN